MSEFPSIPVSRYLVPDAPPSAPEGFTTLEQPIANGLPHVMDLDRDLRLLLIVPTGMAVTWRDTDPALVVSDSTTDVTAFDPAAGAAFLAPGRVPARLVLLGTDGSFSSTPLAAGAQAMLPGDAMGEQRLDLVVLSWQIHAGTLRGPGAFGSRIALAWRRVGKAVEEFSTPPPNPVILPRLKPSGRLQSALGLRALEAFSARFATKKAIARIRL